MNIPVIRKREDQKLSEAELELEHGFQLIQSHPLFGLLPNTIILVKENPVKAGIATVDLNGDIRLNRKAELFASEWAYVIAHCALHHVFGHFDIDRVPGYIMEKETGKKKLVADFIPRVWNLACDISIMRFLADIKFGQSLKEENICPVPNGVRSELEIYQYLMENQIPADKQVYGVSAEHRMDMVGLETLLACQSNSYHSRYNPYQKVFSDAIKRSVKDAIADVSGGEKKRYYGSLVSDAAKWFVNHYPLLGGVASSFRIVEDSLYCVRNQIQVAAIDISAGEIYVNTAMKLSEEEWKFVLAHEYLHAGLAHRERCGNRDFNLWNIACDFVINSWLVEMKIGTMPSIGVLYDPDLDNLSAETIYDMLQENLRKAKKLNTFRGYGMGDIIGGKKTAQPVYGHNMTMNDVCREALLQGLEYQEHAGRGTIPAGLVEEIRALAMPPVPWDVELANWFQEFFPLADKQRSYARPSRRQGSTPNIPRPRYIIRDELDNQKTFGVIVDTSGSMSTTQIGMALGAIASYAKEREVPYARVIFCDAAAYDAGYISPEEIAGTVEVKGRGGTRLQPAIDLLEKAKDFPKDGPILMITDGGIEAKLNIHRKHAYLLPKGNRLPFRTKAPVFYYE